MKGCTLSYVTAQPWVTGLQHPLYGALDTYERVAAWVRACPTVDDWGGGTGYLGTLLPATTRYRVIDGTVQVSEQVLADLTTFGESADGIVLRHVLELNTNWRAILSAAVRLFRRRMAVVTFTPDAFETGAVKVKSGWPVFHFAPDDLRTVMGAHLVHEEWLYTTHPERVFYLERAAA